MFGSYTPSSHGTTVAYASKAVMLRSTIPWRRFKGCPSVSQAESAIPTGEDMTWRSMSTLRRLLIAGIVAVLTACATRAAEPPPIRQVVFVCEHGNVKSLMAATYFNELARSRGLPFRAVSRGLALDSDTVPEFVKAPLTAEGYDVSTFRPQPLTDDDIAASARVIAISTALPADTTSTAAKSEQWNDVPPASTDYARSRDSIRAHVAELLDRLARH
jgi:arsenate reductase (thioredoxin)